MPNPIQTLIAQGKTLEALELLAQQNDDAILLKARYNNAKKQYNMALITYDEWQRTQNQINYAALEMAGEEGVTVSEEGGDVKVSKDTGQLASSDSIATVFISYNHNDKAIAQRIKTFLEDRNVDVRIDVEDMVVGQSIRDFILNEIKNNHSVLSLISENSLRSGWVGLESDLAMYSQLLKDTGFIPVMIDTGVFDGNLFFDIVKDIDAKIEDLDSKIEQAKKLKIGYNQFESERSRLLEQRNNLPAVIDHFQNVLIADISGDNFDTGMESVLQAVSP